jgi:hypothetical protein
MSHKAESVDEGGRMGDRRPPGSGHEGMRSKFDEDSRCRRRRLSKGE